MHNMFKYYNKGPNYILALVCMQKSLGWEFNERIDDGSHA